MKRFYDKLNNRIIYYGDKASPLYWDKHWGSKKINKNVYSVGLIGIFKKLFYRGSGSKIARYTKKYLPINSKIIEGGCGLGQYVNELNESFDIVGVDSAPETIDRIKKIYPDLNIKKDDVRKLSFESNFFDGYWSLGVVEHFWDGYDNILNEMSRVIKNGGYLFITFPHMSKLRKLKSFFGFYTNMKEGFDYKQKFYQFCLDENREIKKFEKNNFSLIEKYYFDGMLGLTNEIPLVKKIYNFTKKNKFFFIFFQIIDKLIAPFSSHCVLLVFKKDLN